MRRRRGWLAATLPTLEFKPGVHMSSAETVLRMRDGLPKVPYHT